MLWMKVASALNGLRIWSNLLKKTIESGEVNIHMRGLRNLVCLLPSTDEIVRVDHGYPEWFCFVP